MMREDGGVSAVSRVLHTERFEQRRREVSMPRLAAGRFDHSADEHIAGVVVHPPFARRELAEPRGLHTREVAISTFLGKAIQCGFLEYGRWKCAHP